MVCNKTPDFFNERPPPQLPGTVGLWAGTTKNHRHHPQWPLPTTKGHMVGGGGGGRATGSSSSGLKRPLD
jgi:hypothetical protein